MRAHGIINFSNIIILYSSSLLFHYIFKKYSFIITFKYISVVFQKLHSFLYVSGNPCPKVWINCVPLSSYLSLSFSIIPCVCIRARRIGGMPRITNHESVNLERESGVEQMNSRRGRRISQLLNLAEANASFVDDGLVKQGITVQRHFCFDAKVWDHLLTQKDKRDRWPLYILNRWKGIHISVTYIKHYWISWITFVENIVS